jgi:uncharacterized caspase-like protein
MQGGVNGMANRALLVGINQYREQPLRGCVNDVEDVEQFLVEKCGFEKAHIRALTDAQATAENIKRGLDDWLLHGAAAGDRLLFHYSGHGSLLPGEDGNIHDVICPVDFDFTEAHSLSDADFRKVFSVIPEGVQFNWNSDSCHSGDLARGWGMGIARALGIRYVKSRYLPPPPQIMQQIERLRRRNATTRALSRALDHLHGVLIAGCQSNETAADAIFQRRANGALTYFLLQELRAPRGLTLDISSIVSSVARAVVTNGYSQHPQIRGLPAICAKPFLASAG